ANMPRLTAFRPGDRLDALRPFPSRFERQAGCGSATHLDDVNLRLVRRPGFVGRVEGTDYKSSHTSLLSSVVRASHPKRVGDRSLIFSRSLALPNVDGSITCCRQPAAQNQAGMTDG